MSHIVYRIQDGDRAAVAKLSELMLGTSAGALRLKAEFEGGGSGPIELPGTVKEMLAVALRVLADEGRITLATGPDAR